jgi:hypothetical protein
VHAAVTRLADGGESSAPPPVEAQTPAVSIRKSVTPDYLICLDDGKKFKSLKRRLTIARPNRVRGTGGRIEGRWNSDFSGDERLGLLGVVHGKLAIRPSDFAERDCRAGANAFGRSRAVAP